ncbi:MAG: hypothetical protein WC515_06795 [Candidatus Omnitrophota bacterium]
MLFKKVPVVTAVLLFAALVLVYRSGSRAFLRSTPGSFEYVRKGDDLLDKGKYREAVGSFEKAYEASPDNREIKLGLIYAYSKYAASFAEKDDHDRAVEYLAKAREVLPNAHTGQNLALMLARRSLKRARSGDWAGAITDLREARTLTEGSAAASRNLGISLFNDAFGEYKEGREKIAIFLLKGAELAYPDARILRFIGDIYYRRNEPETAAFYWARGLAMDPADKTLAEDLEKAAKEAGLAASKEKIELPNFNIVYGRGLSVEIGRVSRILSGAYMDIGKDLAYFPSAKTTVFFYSEDDFREIFKVPGAVRAFYDGNIRMPFYRDTADDEELGRYLYHEYTHAVVSAKTKGNCPVWFSEGIATWEGLKGREDEAKGSLSGDILPYLSIDALDRAFKDGAKDADMRACYILSYTVVRYVIDNWGIGGLRALLDRMATGQHIANAIDDEFLMSEKEFGRRWAEYVRGRYLN